MNSEQLKDLKFYCNQLNIKTLKQLKSFKNKHKAKTSENLLNKLCKAYNGKEYNKIYFKD